MMHSDSVSNQYEQALTLAESGQHQQALEQILSYLKSNPTDAQALNDTGTILYCLQRGGEAIEYLEKAMQYSRADQRQQVSWNLCEVYITESLPEKARDLFGQMQAWDVLNADIVNRTADVFLKQNKVGKAVDVLSLSVRLWPDQKILEPMIEVLSKQRSKAVIFSDSDRPLCRTLSLSLDRWMPTKCCIGGQADHVQDVMQTAAISIFVGCGVSLVYGSKGQRNTPKIVIVDEQDIYGPMAGLITQSGVDTVIACAGPEAIEDLREQTGHFNIIAAEPIPQVDLMPLYEKKPGLRVASVGPWNLRQNPMFLFQCFQKLNYIHPDSRLYLAGEFEDPGLERYLEHLTEIMDLENQIFFEGPVKNLNKWLKDKHVIVSTAVDSSAMGGIWMGMACGLKPAVHRFPGAKAIIDEQFIFDISEEFCCQVESKDYQSVQYRRFASDRFEQTGLALKLHAAICELEENAKSIPQIGTSATVPFEMKRQTIEPIASIPDTIPYQSLCLEMEPLANNLGPESVN